MYLLSDTTELARNWSRPTPTSTRTDTPTRLALKRIDKALTAFTTGMPFDRDRLRSRLDAPAETTAVENERLFALGWLHWFDGKFAEAEPLLQGSVDRLRDDVGSVAKDEEPALLELLARSAYWLARVQILLDRSDAIKEYEGIMRLLRGSPQGTAWYVDLLWRAGRVDRAEQVWKSVRTNRKVTACDEGALLEARTSMRKGETTAAERQLSEGKSGNGVVQAERCLYLAWIATARKKHDQAQDWLRQAEQRLYPTSALEQWRTILQQKADQPLGDAEEESDAKAELPVPASLRELFQGQQARLDGNDEQAIAYFQKALEQPASKMWAEYLLAVLGVGDRAEVFGNPASLFLAVRSRGWSALERFRERQATADHWLSELHQQLGQGFRTNATVEHFHQLGSLLAQKRPVADALGQAVEEHASDPPTQQRNFLLAAVEQAVQHLDNHAASQLLRTWLGLDWVQADDALAPHLRQQLLRVLIREHIQNPTTDPVLEPTLAGEPLLALVSGDAPVAQDSPSAQLDRSASQLADGSLEPEAWRANVERLRREKGYKMPAQILLFQEAAARQDIPRVTTLLQDLEAWRGSRLPPKFVLQTLVNLVAVHSQNPVWKQVLPNWLALWHTEALGEEGQRLLAQAGQASLSPSQSEAPVGVEPSAWFLHQMAKAFLREDYLEGLACLCRAQEVGGNLASLPETALLQESLPELERRAQAQALADALVPGTGSRASSLVDVIDILPTFSAGQRLLEDADQGDSDHIREGLASLVEIPDLPDPLWHHLAILEMRQARALDERGRTMAALPHFRRSWQAWLHHLSKHYVEEGTLSRQGAVLLDAGLTWHRQRLTSLMAEGRVDASRVHWGVVLELPSHGEDLDETLFEDLLERIDNFRERLATDYLAMTREAMRYGEIPEGWEFDYEKGLSYLRRLMSLDNDNLRLLTALVEICNDWFLDLYNARDPAKLDEELERYTPFALQLFRLVEEEPGELAAKGALSDFYKFRGFMSRSEEERRSHYEEAIRLNPGNKNARELLAKLDGDNVGYDDDDFDASLDDDFDAPREPNEPEA